MPTHAKSKAQAQKWPEKTLSLYLRLNLGTRIAHNNFKKQQQNTSKPCEGRDCDFHRYHIIRFLVTKELPKNNVSVWHIANTQYLLYSKHRMRPLYGYNL